MNRHRARALPSTAPNPGIPAAGLLFGVQKRQIPDALVVDGVH
ncbi:hypothetical protein [Streptosporangium sp. NPDC000509]